MALYLGNQLIGNGIYLGDTNYRDGNVFMSQSTVPTNPVTSGRILELNTSAESAPLDSTTWRDISGNGYNFAQTGSATFNSTTGWTLNGTSQYLTSNAAIHSWFTGSLASSGVTLFVNINKTNDESVGLMFAGWYDLTAQYKILFEVTDQNYANYAIANTTGPAGNNTTSKLGVGGVQRVMMLSYDPNTLSVYNNNSQMSGSVVVTGDWSTATPPWSIGARYISSYSNFFGGTIKSVLLYNRALTSDERTQVYNYLLAL